MAVRSVVIELLVADGVCSCTAGLSRWHLSEFIDGFDRVRRARCLRCDRVWEKRLDGEQYPYEEYSWRSAKTREVTDG